MYTNYSVVVEKYAERHYIKKFQKKYKNYWDITWKGLNEQFKRLGELLNTDLIDEICQNGSLYIYKLDFRVAGTKQSRKDSGNRIILLVDNKNKEIKILLVYHKNDLPSKKNETATWKSIVKENYNDCNFL